MKSHNITRVRAPDSAHNLSLGLARSPISRYIDAASITKKKDLGKWALCCKISRKSLELALHDKRVKNSSPGHWGRSRLKQRIGTNCSYFKSRSQSPGIKCMAISFLCHSSGISYLTMGKKKNAPARGYLFMFSIIVRTWGVSRARNKFGGSMQEVPGKKEEED